MTMRLFPILSLLAVSAYGAEPAWQNCADFYSEKTPLGTLYNNVWNKGAAKGFAWSQCVEKDAASGLSGWSWRWPAKGSDIFGYPQIKLGTSPWAPSPDADPRFPLDNATLRSLVVEHELEVQGNTEHNVATSLWLTNTKEIGTQPNPSAIVAELMIWSYATPRHMTPAGAHRGDFNDGNQDWEVWFDKNWSDMSGANQNKWIYITFRAKNKNLKAKFDVVKLTQYAIAQKILPPQFYFADIELGTEIMRGAGQARVRQFNVAIESLAQPAAYTFIEGRLPQDMQPDGNSIVIEGPAEMLVIDTGRHPGHTDKIIALAKAKNKPVVPLPFFDTGCAQGWREALAEIDQLDFQTLVPGHGLPMDHATFSTYRRAFDAFTACAESDQPTQACVATWTQQGHVFAATPS